MKVVEFPSKGKKKKCTCAYLYRLGFKPEDGTFGVVIGKNLGNDTVQEMTFLSGFDEESEAEAAAFGFLEALHYVHTGGTL